VRILDVAVNAHSTLRAAPGNIADLVERASDYLPTLQARLDRARPTSTSTCACTTPAWIRTRTARWAACPVSTRRCWRAGAMVFDWCRERRLPVAFVLAGGYVGPGLDQASLVALHRLTLHAAAG
jgi:hypothetical protein